MFELSLMCSARQIENLSDALDALEALSVSVEDADAQTDAEQALFGEPGMPPPADGWQRSRVTALFPEESLAHEALAILQMQDFFNDCQFLAVNAVPDQDWVRLTQAQFVPVEITEDFWIVPTWHEPPAQARKVIRLDPGLAFGTGTHPTTRMCLKWIAGHPGAARVLDYGCGSGILAIGAAMFGASEVIAVDIDETAIDATQQNALANKVQVMAGLPEVARGVYDLVLANILATPLKVLAPLLRSHVVSGGSLVLAGILDRQSDELIEAYAPYCQLQISDRQEGWILMTAKA
jgi:ribosomal protein L11 methyltransferase